MSIGTQIAQYRKDKGITQEALANQLNVTNQAVSKWESDQCCPDIQMLPKLADLFDITIDALFERETIHSDSAKRIPWRNDDSFHIALYHGHKLLTSSAHAGKFVFQYKGLAKNISSAISVECGDVQGNVDAGTDVKCGNIGGKVDAGTDVYCGNVGGHVDAGADVYCGNVAGSVDAGADVTCGDVKGNIDAGGTVTIRK